MKIVFDLDEVLDMVIEHMERDYMGEQLSLPIEWQGKRLRAEWIEHGVISGAVTGVCVSVDEERDATASTTAMPPHMPQECPPTPTPTPSSSPPTAPEKGR